MSAGRAPPGGALHDGVCTPSTWPLSRCSLRRLTPSPRLEGRCGVAGREPSEPLIGCLWRERRNSSTGGHSRWQPHLVAQRTAGEPNRIPAFGRHTILLVAEIVGACLFHQPDLARALAIVLLYASGRLHRRRHRR